MADKLKISLAVACIIAGVWGYYFFAETAQVLRVLMVMAGLVAAGGVAWLSAPAWWQRFWSNRNRSSTANLRALPEIRRWHE